MEDRVKAPLKEIFGAQAGICTQVRGFAVRCIATLPPMLYLSVTDLMFEYSSYETTNHYQYQEAYLDGADVHPRLVPDVSSRYDGLGVGFAPYLQPPGPEVIRWTVGEPGFDTPREIIDSAIKGLEEGNTK